MLPAGTTVAENTITLANDTTAVLVKVDEGDDRARVFVKAFDAAFIKREQLVAKIKEMPHNATVRLVSPGGKPVVITGDVDRAVEAIRKAAVGTRVSVDMGNRKGDFPRLR